MSGFPFERDKTWLGMVAQSIDGLAKCVIIDHTAQPCKSILFGIEISVSCNQFIRSWVIVRRIWPGGFRKAKLI